MTEHPFEINLLGKEDRSDFCCGSEPLDRYFKTQVGQDMRRRVSARCRALKANENPAQYATPISLHALPDGEPDDAAEVLRLLRLCR